MWHVSSSCSGVATLRTAMHLLLTYLLTFAKVCNTSFREVVFPRNLKQSLVWPRLKKSTLDPDDLCAYRPISNLTFLSKVVEQAEAVRLRRHLESATSSWSPVSVPIVSLGRDRRRRRARRGRQDYNVCAVVLVDLSAVLIPSTTRSSCRYWTSALPSKAGRWTCAHRTSVSGHKLSA